SFRSDQYEHVIEYVGFAASWDRLVFRGRPQSRKFLGFYLRDRVMLAAVGLDRGGDPEDPTSDSELRIVADLIRRRFIVDPARLADESVDLHYVSAASSRCLAVAEFDNLGPRILGWAMPIQELLDELLTSLETGPHITAVRQFEARHAVF